MWCRLVPSSADSGFEISYSQIQDSLALYNIIFIVPEGFVSFAFPHDMPEYPYLTVVAEIMTLADAPKLKQFGDEFILEFEM